jgi:hypothetical protein
MGMDNSQDDTSPREVKKVDFSNVYGKHVNQLNSNVPRRALGQTPISEEDPATAINRLVRFLDEVDLDSRGLDTYEERHRFVRGCLVGYVEYLSAVKNAIWKLIPGGD